MKQTRQLCEVIKSISITHKFDKEKLIFLNTSDVLEGKILSDKYFSVSELKGQAKKTILNNDILYSEIRPKNKRFAYVNVKNPQDYVVSTKLMVLRNITTDVDTKYVYYFLTYEGTINYLQMRAENRIGSFPQITFDILKPINISFPLLEEQKKIVKIISSIDDKIELNYKINKELEAMAKTLYDYWFVQFDFPDVNGKPYKSSGGKMVYNQELKREIPHGWEIRKLKELLINCTDGISNLKLNTEDKYTPIDYLPMKRMSFGDYLPSSEANSSLIQYKAKDILIGAMRVYFHRVCIAPFDGITRTTSLVLRPINEKHLPYLYQVCNEEKTISVATKLSSGTQQPYVNWEKSLENYKIAYPNNILLIDKYSDKMNNIINQVVLNEQQNQELAKFRDWLLPMLMNGQVRVK